MKWLKSLVKWATFRWPIIKVVLVIVAAIVLAIVARNAVVGIVGIVWAFGQSLLGEPSDQPRRTASGHIPNPPRLPEDGDTAVPPVTPGNPDTGPRRRRR